MARFCNQQGLALLGVLVAIVILGLLSGVASTSWKDTVQRSKEQELLWRGNQYRQAIESYYRSAQAGTQSSFPADLNSLVNDGRSLTVRRHLRQLYPDPMTGNDWAVIRNSAGKIVGVQSESNAVPFKKDGFIEENNAFIQATCYSDWCFVFNNHK